jgi:hypothetical protein
MAAHDWLATRCTARGKPRSAKVKATLFDDLERTLPYPLILKPLRVADYFEVTCDNPRGVRCSLEGLVGPVHAPARVNVADGMVRGGLFLRSVR